MLNRIWSRLHSIRSGLRAAFLAVPSTIRGYRSHRNWRVLNKPQEMPDQTNPLRDFFNRRRQGHGIWKWDHYFDIYHRHFSRFRGREVHVLEIGIFSGGSLEMWRDYFGSEAHIYGVDIEAACKRYENGMIKVFIGDQADREFWGQFRKEVPILDLVIDDGGHEPEQQIVSLEELFPHLRPGGVYVCEDVTKIFNPFISYMTGMVHQLNAYKGAGSEVNGSESRISYKTTPFQSAVDSIHFYPFVTVVERTPSPVIELTAPKHGTEWQPFLDPVLPARLRSPR
jgi:hypothetical protein